jgi:integrase
VSALPTTVAAPRAHSPSPNGPAELTGLLVNEYLTRWLSHMRGRVRATTFAGYETLIRCHAIPLLGAIPLADLRPLHLQDIYGQLLAGSTIRRPLRPGTVRNFHLVLAQAFGQAVRWQLLVASPATGAQPPRPSTRLHAVADPALLQRILNQLAGHPLELPTAVAIATGMRRGEILALRGSDLDDDYTVARVQRNLQTTKAELQFEQPKTRPPNAPSPSPSSSTPTSNGNATRKPSDKSAPAPTGTTYSSSSIVVTARP